MGVRGASSSSSPRLFSCERGSRSCVCRHGECASGESRCCIAPPFMFPASAAAGKRAGVWDGWDAPAHGIGRLTLQPRLFKTAAAPRKTQQQHYSKPRAWLKHASKTSRHWRIERREKSLGRIPLKCHFAATNNAKMHQINPDNCTFLPFSCLCINQITGFLPWTR